MYSGLSLAIKGVTEGGEGWRVRGRVEEEEGKGGG